MANWVINVKPTRYNFLGAVREFGKALPWDFPVSQNIKEDDTVYFYLTSTGTGEGISDKMVEKIFKRFVLKGVIIDVKDKDDRDTKYWTDNKRGEDDGTKKHCAIIKISDSFYDGEVTSGELKEFPWNPGATYPISENDAKKIENGRKK